MRHIADILKELGFNKDAPLETQKAFLRHLAKAAAVTDISRKTKDLPPPPEQLSFNLENQVADESGEGKVQLLKIGRR